MTVGCKATSQRERAVVFGVTPDLQDAVAQFGERRRQVGRGCRFTDPPLP